MREDARKVDELVENIVNVATFGASPATEYAISFGSTTNQLLFDDQRFDDANLMVLEQ